MHLCRCGGESRRVGATPGGHHDVDATGRTSISQTKLLPCRCGSVSAEAYASAPSRRCKVDNAHLNWALVLQIYLKKEPISLSSRWIDRRQND